MAVKGSFPFRQTGSIKVKGRAEPIQTYALEEPELAVIAASAAQ